MSHQFEALLRKYHIQHRVASPCHPQTNGQVESTNKVIEAILTKKVKRHHRDWVDRIPESLWAYRTTWHNTTGFSPYDLVYGKSVVFPIEFEINTLKTATEVNLDVTEAQKRRLNKLNKLDENQLAAVDQTLLIQQQRSNWHNQFIKKKVLCEGDWALLYNSRFKRDFKGKLRTRWLGPYLVDRVFDKGTVCLVTIVENHAPLFANGHRLRLYHKPISKESFISQIATDPEYQLAQGQELFSAPLNP